MSIGFLVSLMRGAVFQVFYMCTPILGAALIVGLFVAIFQATTSIQEQTLTFLPKMVVILGMLTFFGGMMFAQLRGYTFNLFAMIPQLAQ